MNTILICIIICSVYSLIIYQVLSRRINKKINNKTFLNDVKEEINLLITQINETSDRNVLLIENRLERLNSLLAASDKRLSNLKSAVLENKNQKLAPIKTKVIDPILVPEPAIDSFEVVDDDPSLSRKERILLLHKQGISASVIASQTKATIGEVDLIISLSRG